MTPDFTSEGADYVSQVLQVAVDRVSLTAVVLVGLIVLTGVAVFAITRAVYLREFRRQLDAIGLGQPRDANG